MTDPTTAPGHTDLMVSPESIDAFLEENPPSDGNQPTDHADDWQCPACGEWWPDIVAADYCQACHEKVVFAEDEADV